MAKIRGIFQFNGKLGEAVGMKGDDGQNYARVRVRDIANPDTKAQQEQRTAVSLAGKISSLTPRDLITGMKGSNNRKRRSNFTRNIINNADVAVADGVNTAKIDPEKLILSEGKNVEVPTMTLAMSGALVNVTPTAWPENEDLAACVIVAYGYNEDREYIDCKYTTITAGSTEPAGLIMGKGVVGAVVYAIPVIRNTETSSTKYQSALEALEDNAEFAVTSSGTEGSALSYGASTYLDEVEPA